MSFPSKDLLNTFPIDQIFLIVSAGLLFTLCFPFDIFAINFANGLTAENLSNIPNLLTENFKPFILVKYLSDFPNGLVQIFLASLLPGLFIFFFYDTIQKINGFIFRQKVSSRIVKAIPFEEKVKGTKEQIAFNKWLRENNSHKYINFLWSLHCVAIGWLYALELLFFGYLIIPAIIAINQKAIFPSMYWTILFLIMTIVSYVLFLSSKRHFNEKFLVFFDAFQNTKTKNLDQWLN